MASEHLRSRLRLLMAALLWAGSGALAQAAGPSLRMALGAALLALLGAAVAWPLAGGRRPHASPPSQAPSNPDPNALSLTAPPLPGPGPGSDARQLLILEARLEHLPVAAWVGLDGRLQPLTNRARRLVAPGEVRDPQALHQLLLGAKASGPVLLDTERGSERWQLRRQALTLDSAEQTLLVLMPLENELESASLQAWQQLVQVLTHEIMNSLTPIKSLSESSLALLDEQYTDVGDGAARPASERAELPELRLALDAIRHRADGLSRFVSTYRQVSQWPAPELAPVDLQALLTRLQQAVAPAWTARGGAASFELAAPGLRLQADAGQLEQALLALLTNAAQATAGQAAPRLWVQARMGRGGRLLVSVRDNGPGVPAGLERQIFLPFFSAQEGGQGIGLTVVRQLVHGMGGRVRHVRPVEGGAAFVLSF